MCTDGYFPLGANVCIVWATLDVLMCTASIWHMATISVDRYCSLRFPYRYRRTRTPVFVVAKIAFVWIVSIGICSPLAVVGFINPLNVYRGGQCAPAVTQFVIYGSIFAFYVPLVLMLVSYALTVKTLTRQAISRWRQRRLSSSQIAKQDGGDFTSSVRCFAAITLPTIDTENSQSVEYPSTTLQPDGEYDADHRRPRASSTTALDTVNSEGEAAEESAEDLRVNSKLLCGGTLLTQEPMLTPQDGATDAHANSDCIRSAVSLAGESTAPVKAENGCDVCVDDRQQINDHRCNRMSTAEDTERRNTTDLRLFDPRNGHDAKDDEKVVSSRSDFRSHQPERSSLPRQESRRRSRRREANRLQSFSTKTRRIKRKATRVLGLIFVVFIVLWTPFFVLNMLSAVCPRCVQSVSPGVWTVIVWMGWISSLANPVIYTSFSPAFRSTFKRLLSCRCESKLSLAKRRQQKLADLLKDYRDHSDSL